MKIDTGTSVLLISQERTKIKWLVPQLTLNTNKEPLLHTYTDSIVQPLSQVQLGLDHNNQHHNLNAFVVPRWGPSLLGRDWLSVLELNLAGVDHVDRYDLLEPYQAVLSEGMTLKGVTAQFYADDTVKRYCNSRPVPLTLRQKWTPSQSVYTKKESIVLSVIRKGQHRFYLY